MIEVKYHKDIKAFNISDPTSDLSIFANKINIGENGNLVFLYLEKHYVGYFNLAFSTITLTELKALIISSKVE